MGPIASVFRKISAFPRAVKLSIIVILLIVGGFAVYRVRSSGGTNGYIMEPVKRGTVVEVVNDSGTIVSGGYVDIASPSDGIIDAIYVQNGQPVKPGDKLFTVISSATKEEQESAYSTYLAAVSALKASQGTAHSLRSAMYTKWKTYFDLATNDTYEKSNGVPDETNRNAAEFQSAKETWLGAEQQVINQDAVVSANQAAVTAAWTAYQATQTTTVTAEIPGIVENLAVASGSAVQAVTALNPNVLPVLMISSGGTPETDLAVSQTNIAGVKPGQKAVIYPDAYTDRNFPGTVARVDTVGHTTAGVVSYNVYIRMNDSRGLLKPGMTVDGDIMTNEKKNVLTVPNSAVVLYKNGKAVRVLAGGTMTYIPVETGIKGETTTEIVRGLREGQQVITALTNEKVERKGLLGL
ncbi:efflux RND transporter periplasmic adaptor subunit [Patescibacteria group bacterium]|nr:efflux RND transporter periplasmic adaptor subunit [Patescibacteria group bacterium]